MHAMATFAPGEFSLNPQPGMRKIGFEEDPSQFTTTHFLIFSWGVERELGEPSDDPTPDIKAWVKETNPLSREEREQIPQTAESSNVRTPWRDQLYYVWNHVLFDVGNFMSCAYGTATFKPPGTEVFGIEFPVTEGDEKVLPVEKVWESDTLFAAAYLAPGVSLRLETISPRREDQEPFHASDINQKSRYNVWYLRKEIKVRFCVEHEGERPVEGLAAVVVFGKMLGEPIPPSSDESESENEEDDEVEDEKE